MVAKRALLIGINYPGSKHALKGCCNDVLMIKSTLQEQYGFNERDMVILVDEGKGYEKPTGHNIKTYMKEMVRKSDSGDVLFLHFSGHGTQVPNPRATEEVDGKDEALVPCDMNLILDDDINDILSGLKEGVNCTFVSDCCHSGTMTDGGHQPISGKKNTTDLRDFDISACGVGGGSTGSRDINTEDSNGGGILSCLSGCLGQTKGDVEVNSIKRDIPFNEIFQMLGGLSSGKVDSSNVLTVLGSLFGSDATCKANPQGGCTKHLGDDRFVLISGCQDHETSADVPARGGKPACGAMTSALTTVLAEYPKQNGGKQPSYRTTVLAVRNILIKQGMTQSPCLEATEENADRPFLVFQ